MVLVRDRALCLTRHPWSESSLVVHALTREHGRVHFVARGAYRMTSRYFAVLDLFDELEIEWNHSPRRELQELRAGSIATRRRFVRADLDAYKAAVTVLELADLAARHDRSDVGLFALANEALGRVERGVESAAVSLVRFELAFLDHLGLAPALERCASCGGEAAPVILRPEKRAAFSAGAGGRLCRDCAEEARAAGRRVGTLPVAVLAEGLRLQPRERLAGARRNEEGRGGPDADGRISRASDVRAGSRAPDDPAKDRAAMAEEVTRKTEQVRGSVLSERVRDCSMTERVRDGSRTERARGGSRTERVRDGSMTESARGGAMTERGSLTERVRDFVGRFLNYHLETRPRSQRAFLDSPNRNAPAVTHGSRPNP